MLTGHQFFDYHERNNKGNISRKDIAIGAGYVYPNGRIRWIDFYSELLKCQTRFKSFRNPNKVKSIERLMDAIVERRDYKYRNDIVVSYADQATSFFYYRGEIIAAVFHNVVRIYRKYNKNSTRSNGENMRIASILRRFCGCELKGNVISIPGSTGIDITHDDVDIPILD